MFASAPDAGFCAAKARYSTAVDSGCIKKELDPAVFGNLVKGEVL
jgi:hypothetical protein